MAITKLDRSEPLSAPESPTWLDPLLNAIKQLRFGLRGDHGGSPTAAEEVRAFALGLNWYLNQNVKLVMDYEQTMFDGGGGGTADAPETSKTKKSFSVGCSSTFNPA